jgi:acetolactate synthase-1/2/3 large subunit
MAETFPPRVERGGGLPVAPRLPYFPEEATEALAAGSRVVLAGAREPIAFFGYPDLPSALAPPGMPVDTLADPDEDAAGALEALAEAVDASGPGDGAAISRSPRPSPPASRRARSSSTRGSPSVRSTCRRRRGPRGTRTWR